MPEVHIGRGSIVVEQPEDSLLEGLCRFRHDTGQYEDLYQRAVRHDALVTMPGYAKRVIDLSRYSKVFDDRMPMPEPIPIEIEEVWKEALTKAIQAESGVISVPEFLGFSRTAAAILTAYPKERLVDRGTPLSIVSTKDSESAVRIREELKALLPGRSVGRLDSDDIVVAAYRALRDTPRHVTGVFIGEGMDDLTEHVEGISAIRNAVRFEIVTSPAGGNIDVDIVAEGLFGPLVASVSYADAVAAGLAVPITVCWVPCPRPRVPLGSASLDLLEAIAHPENLAFVQDVSEIVRSVSGDLGCLVRAQTVALSKRLVASVPSLLAIDAKNRSRESKIQLADVSQGIVRKAVLSSGIRPYRPNHGVLVMATCQGASSVNMIPWRALQHAGEKAYIVDFTHPWDVHNGRPGRIALNDKARRRRYQEMGLNQIQVREVRELPFV